MLRPCRAKRFLGGGWGGLLALVPIAQCGEQKDGGNAGQSAGDTEDAVSVNEAVRGAVEGARGQKWRSKGSLPGL